jgi:hypothetical protein
MAIIPSVFSNHFEAIHFGKTQFVAFNEHPHRLAGISMTGSTTIESDPRTLAGGLFCTRTIWTVDYSLLPAWERLMRPQTPILATSIPATQGKFHLTQDVRYFWRFFLAFGPPFDPVEIGEVTDYLYTRPTTGDPWVLAAESSYGIDAEWTPTIGVPYLGGHPDSGGRGANDLPNSVAFNPPQLAYLADALIARLPWQDPWTDESAAFEDSLTDILDTQNALGTSVWTGETTATMVFS